MTDGPRDVEVDNAEYIFAHLFDPSVADPPTPTPYTNLPLLVDLIREAMKQQPPAVIVERFSKAMDLATRMLEPA